jgi:outer membrane protein OmpA-like peptidoglycan-associated protein
MKINFTLILFLFALSGFAQSKPFSLQDTILARGQTYTSRQIMFELGKVNLKPESSVALDSIVWFMKKNNTSRVEVDVHSDSRTNPNCCSNLTEGRARSIAEYLVRNGIAMERLIAKGYGEVKLLVSDAEINKAKTKEEKERLHALNRRVEFKIVN